MIQHEASRFSVANIFNLKREQCRTSVWRHVDTGGNSWGNAETFQDANGCRPLHQQNWYIKASMRTGMKTAGDNANRRIVRRQGKDEQMRGTWETSLGTETSFDSRHQQQTRDKTIKLFPPQTSKPPQNRQAMTST